MKVALQLTKVTNGYFMITAASQLFEAGGASVKNMSQAEKCKYNLSFSDFKWYNLWKKKWLFGLIDQTMALRKILLKFCKKPKWYKNYKNVHSFSFLKTFSQSWLWLNHLWEHHLLLVVYFLCPWRPMRSYCLQVQLWYLSGITILVVIRVQGMGHSHKMLLT